MGSKNKLKRFAENLTFANVVQPERDELVSDSFPLKGKWAAEFFKNDHPIVLELGCGKGEYSVALGRQYPGKNFIGIDIKGARFWRGAKTAVEEKLSNVAFLRAQIELIGNCFGKGEVSEIWITFPDPQIKYRRTKHRLTNPGFLEKYAGILRPAGEIHLKTDSAFLHGYTLGVLQGLGHEILYSQHDVYRDGEAPEYLKTIQTFYEKMYLEKGVPITYIRFRLKK